MTIDSLVASDAAISERHLRDSRRRAVAATRPARRSLVRHGCILLGYVALGVLLTWPRATYLTGRLPNTRDQASYVWDMWWVAHQVEHFASPFTTHQMFAPAGVALAYHALMPLIGVIMIPFTIIAGPAFSVNLLSVVLPGLIGYAMFRAARLWLPSTGALASGVFFGLSSMLTWRTWFQVNVGAGLLFLPITLEAAVRLRRDPSARRAAWLGIVVGLSVLVDLESAVLALIVAGAVLAGWLLAPPRRRSLQLLSLAAASALVAATPQVMAMLQEGVAAASHQRSLASSYARYAVALPQLFTPSPRVSAFGLHWLAEPFSDGIKTEGMPTFGLTLTALALLGAVIGWRRRRDRLWLLLWLGTGLLALGPVLYLGTHANIPLPTRDHGRTMSLLLPYTWFVRLPGLADFREANRFTPLGLLGAALLAGSAVAWIRTRLALALVPLAALATLELGWSAAGPQGTMPAGLPAVDHAIAADPSRSLVVDVPLGFRSGTAQLGVTFPAEELVEATLDGHPRAGGYVSRVTDTTLAALRGHAFYADLLNRQPEVDDTGAVVQSGAAAGDGVGQAAVPAAAGGVRAAALDARRMNVGWVLVWTPVTPGVGTFLRQTGFSLRYRVDGVSVYRAVSMKRQYPTAAG